MSITERADARRGTVTFETPDVGGSSTGPGGYPDRSWVRGRPPSRGGWLRVSAGRRQDALWVRPALLALLAVTAVLYLWDLSTSGWANSFYSAAVPGGYEELEGLLLRLLRLRRTS